VNGPVRLQAALERDRVLAVGGLVAVFVLSWGYLLHLAGAMSAPAAPMAAMPSRWGVVDALLTFLMWAVMMVAMMLPSATPLVLLHMRVTRSRQPRDVALRSAFLMLAGYLAVWTVFSGAATGVQWGLQAAALLTPMMTAVGDPLAGGLLVAAGLYQWTPVKARCLEHCRSPLEFLSAHWWPGPAGAFRTGLHHGLYCVGCCWLLMGLLFVLGVMNLLWVAALAALVLVERTGPAGSVVTRLSGAALAAWGVLTLAGVTD
jgi:predicted metal-binding membrane protein